MKASILKLLAELKSIDSKLFDASNAHYYSHENAVHYLYGFTSDGVGLTKKLAKELETKFENAEKLDGYVIDLQIQKETICNHLINMLAKPLCITR